MQPIKIGSTFVVSTLHMRIIAKSKSFRTVCCVRSTGGPHRMQAAGVVVSALSVMPSPTCNCAKSIAEGFKVWAAP